MGWKVDADGTACGTDHPIPVPNTVSAEARAFLAAPPWGEMSSTPAEPVPMWAMRSFTDQSFALLNAQAAQMFPVDIEEVNIAGVRCHRVQPQGMSEAESRRLLINLHGGGFVLGSGSLVEAIPIAHLARVPVLAVDYRLAPEHAFPAAVDDALAVYRDALGHHAPEQIGIYGSSAGGYLTAQATMRIRHDGLPQPACLGVFTAGGSLADHGDTVNLFSLAGFHGELLLPLDHPLSEVRAFLGGADPRDPLVSPIFGDLGGFPPTLLISGTRDALLSASALFHRALRRAGVQTDQVVFEAMPHAHWYVLHLPEAREAIDVMVDFFRRHLRA